MGALDGKVALVTGGSRGIGLAVAQRFAAEGAQVFITGRNKDTLDTAAATIGDAATAVTADVSSLGDLDRLYSVIGDQAGRLDVLVANAAVGESALLAQVTPEQFDAHLQHRYARRVLHGAEGAPAARRGRLGDHDELRPVAQGPAREQRLHRGQSLAPVLRAGTDL